MCHMSHVAGHLSTTATATDPPTANSLTMHSRLVHQERTQKLEFFLLKIKKMVHPSKKKGVLSLPILAILPSTRGFQLSWFWLPMEGTTHNIFMDIATSFSWQAFKARLEGKLEIWAGLGLGKNLKLWVWYTEFLGSFQIIQNLTQMITKHCEIAKGCPEYFSSLVEVSSCSYQKTF